MDTTTPPPVGPGVVSRRTLAVGAAWSVPVIMAASAAPAMAASGCSGPRFSAAQVSTYDTPPVAGNLWTNPTNVQADDTSYASRLVSSANSSPYMLTAYNFGFTTAMIPPGSTIVSVTIEVNWHVTDAAGGGTGPEAGAWFQIDAISAQPSTTIGDQHLLTYNGSNWPIGSGNAVTTSYALTGLLPTAAQVVSANFGARVGFGRQSNEEDYVANVDFIRITICYR